MRNMLGYLMEDVSVDDQLFDTDMLLEVHMVHGVHMPEHATNLCGINCIIIALLLHCCTELPIGLYAYGQSDFQ